MVRKSDCGNFTNGGFVKEFQQDLEYAKDFADSELEHDEEGNIIQYANVCDEDNIILHISEGAS